MAVRYRSAFGFLAVACGLAAGAAIVAAQVKAPASSANSARRGWVLERTPDGHPDFQGVWANSTVTPLQRPKQWEGKQRFTDAEVADLQKFAAQSRERRRRAKPAMGSFSPSGPPNPISPIRAPQLQPVLARRPRLARSTDGAHHDPPDGKIPPMTPSAEAARGGDRAPRRAFRIRKCFPWASGA
jgi:hypothetical protein